MSRRQDEKARAGSNGRPPIPADLQRLIVTMARANPTWGEERITHELLLKLTGGLAAHHRTISPARAVASWRTTVPALGHVRPESCNRGPGL